MTLKKIFIKIKIFLNFFKKKHQKSFYLNEKFKNKVKFYKNRICYIYDYYIFNSKDLIEKNYVAKVSKYCEVLLRVVSNNNKFYYKIDKHYYSRKIYPNVLNFLKIDLIKAKKIQIINNDNIKIFKPLFAQKKNKRKLVLALLVDGFGYDILNHLPNTKKFFGLSNLFTNVWANSNWTLPSYGNFITGKYAANHKGYNSESRYDSNSIVKYETNLNIYEYFSKLGFVTGCYSPYLRINPTYDSARGADFFYNNDLCDAHQMSENIISQISMFKNSSNFIFAHYFDGHGPRYKKLRAQEAIFLPSNNRNYNDEENLNKTRAVAEIKHEDEIETIAMFNYIDSHLKKIYQFLKVNKFEDYTIILFGDHGTRLGSKIEKKYILSNNICNINLLIKDKKNSFSSERRKKIIQMIDFFPSLVSRYPNLSKKILKECNSFDGINSIFSEAKNKYSLSETEYNSKSIPERLYEINIRKNAYQLYSASSFKNNKIVNSKDILLDKNQNVIKYNNSYKKVMDEFKKIKKNHLVQYD